MDLSATATGTVSWFDDQGILVGTGNNFTTPNLTATTTYYVQNQDSYNDSLNTEPYSNGIGGGGYVTSDQYEIFNSIVPFTLKSALIYSQSAGNITVQLQDKNASVLATTTVAVPAGQSRVDLNFSVPIDSNLRLVGKNIGTTGLYRNNNSATYPYDLPGILSITGASAGASYYYYFYDWEILTTNSTCASEMVPVQAVVQSCAGIGENISFQRSLKVAPNPNNGQFSVQFTTDYAGTVQVELLNLLGQKVYTESFNHSEGLNSFKVDKKSISKGVYLFNVFFEGKNYTTRVVVE